MTQNLVCVQVKTRGKHVQVSLRAVALAESVAITHGNTRISTVLPHRYGTVHASLGEWFARVQDAVLGPGFMWLCVARGAGELGRWMFEVRVLSACGSGGSSMSVGFDCPIDTDQDPAGKPGDVALTRRRERRGTGDSATRQGYVRGTTICSSL